jgi:transcriptional regulator with XRE-family HTH domain
MLSRDDCEPVEAARLALGRRLAALRQPAGYTQEAFAPLTGYGRSTLANVETGRQNVARGFWKRCADALAAHELLTRCDQIEAMVAAARTRAELQAQQARDARVQEWRRARTTRHGHDSSSGYLPEPEQWERLEHVLMHPENTDLIAVAELREHVRHLDERYVSSPASTLIAEAGRCLGQIEFVAAHARRSDVRRELHSAEAEAATLMGQLVWDASQRRVQDAATTYLRQAVNAARSRGDNAYEGLALLRSSMVDLYGRKDPRAGLQVAEHAVAVTGGASNVLAGLATLHAAEAHAMQGDRTGCEKALGQAETYFGRITPGDPAIDLYSGAQFGRMAGSCYLFLGNPARAASVLEQTALKLRDGSKAEAIVLGNLTLARIRLERIDEAVTALHRALDVIEVNWGGGGINIAFTAGRELRRWRGTIAVRDVRDRLLALMAEA